MVFGWPFWAASLPNLISHVINQKWMLRQAFSAFSNKIRVSWENIWSHGQENSGSNPFCCPWGSYQILHLGADPPSGVWTCRQRTDRHMFGELFVVLQSVLGCTTRSRGLRLRKHTRRFNDVPFRVFHSQLRSRIEGSVKVTHGLQLVIHFPWHTRGRTGVRPTSVHEALIRALDPAGSCFSNATFVAPGWLPEPWTHLFHYSCLSDLAPCKM